MVMKGEAVSENLNEVLNRLLNEVALDFSQNLQILDFENYWPEIIVEEVYHDSEKDRTFLGFWYYIGTKRIGASRKYVEECLASDKTIELKKGIAHELTHLIKTLKYSWDENGKDKNVAICAEEALASFVEHVYAHETREEIIRSYMEFKNTYEVDECYELGVFAALGILDKEKEERWKLARELIEERNPIRVFKVLRKIYQLSKL